MFLAAMADAENPQGMLAVAQWAPVALESVPPRRVCSPCWSRSATRAISTVVRAADAVGADAVP